MALFKKDDEGQYSPRGDNWSWTSYIDPEHCVFVSK